MTPALIALVLIGLLALATLAIVALVDANERINRDLREIHRLGDERREFRRAIESTLVELDRENWSRR